LSGRTVLITGSSRGIGFGIAKAFSANGDKIVLNGYTDKEQLDKSVKILQQENKNVFGFLADMSNFSEAKAAFSDITNRFGSVEILVNNAGRAHFGLFSDTSPAEWDDIMRHNFTNVLTPTYLAIPDMISAKKGVIINISSVWGTTGASCEAVYSAAKGAVHAFTRSMAQELGPSNIRVCAIACGAIETRMNARLSSEEREAFIDNISLMRFGTPEEVGGLARYIASKEASYLTGQIIGLDGGIML